MADEFSTHSRTRDGPYDRAAAVTPDDNADLADVASALLVGGAGNAAVVTAGGDAVTLTGLLAGHVYRVRVKRVKSTGTTATNIVALR